MPQLSPLNRATMAANHAGLFDDEGLARPPEVQTGLQMDEWAERYKEDRYLCPTCNSRHHSQMDAQTCCDVDTETVWVHPTTDEEFESPQALADTYLYGGGWNCPVCGDMHESAIDAAGCCLWTDLDVSARWRIAQAVQAGKPWAEAIATETGEPA